jgi:hypothetical protein
VNDNEAEEDITTGRQVGGVANANETTDRRRKKCSKNTYEERLLEIIIERNRDDIAENKSFLLSLVPSFKKFSDEQKFIAKVEFLNVMRRVSLSQPQYPFSNPHLSNTYFPPNFPPSSNPPGPPSQNSNIGIRSSVQIPSQTHHSFPQQFQPPNTESLPSSYFGFRSSPEQSASTNSSSTLTHMSPSDGSNMSPLSDTELFELH